jgi:hypothetical protein
MHSKGEGNCRIIFFTQYTIASSIILEEIGLTSYFTTEKRDPPALEMQM